MIQIPFDADSVYDRKAYRALSEVSWQYFMMGVARARSYPIMCAMAILMAVSLVFRWGTYSEGMRAGMAFLVVFFLASIPLSAAQAKRRICARSIKDAQKNGLLDQTVRLTFDQEGIHSSVGGQDDFVKHDELACFALYDGYYFLIYAGGACILPVSRFSGAQEQESFEQWIGRRSGKNLDRIHRKLF